MSESHFTSADALALVADFFTTLQAQHNPLLAPLPAPLDKPLADSQQCQFGNTLAGSQYVRDQLLRHPEWFPAELTSEQPLPEINSYLSDLTEQVAAIAADKPLKTQIEGLDKTLRQFRNRCMVRLIWVELNRLAEVEVVTHHLSALAEACIQVAMDFHYRSLCQEVGAPIGQVSGQVQPMLVLGMGKLGAWELNLSSDIDLIFAYPESGDTRALEGTKARRTQSNQEFFVRLGQLLIKSLDSQTADGFVFRTDMRLRPYGQSGPLATNFRFLEEYYQNQGREWERYAMIKARVVAISAVPPVSAAVAKAEAAELMALLRPFSYRRYVDFSVINALREMKALINREVKLRRKTEDVKLGRGGIREVEFIAQVFQLVRGGREHYLQERRVLKVLPMLAEQGYLPLAAVTELLAAYRFLRRVEHAVQAWADRQTQALPVDVKQQARMAYVLGFDSWEAFFQHLQAARDQVNREFQAVVGDEAREQMATPPLPLALWNGVALGLLDREQQLEACAAIGLNDGETILAALATFGQCRAFKGLPAHSRDRLDRVVALVLNAVADLDCQTLAWPELPKLSDAEIIERTLPLLESIARRSAYLVLLLENPTVLPHLLRLFAASAWIAEQITAHPALLEELLDAASLMTVPEPAQLRSELAQVLIGIPADDLEQQMDALRYFRRAHALRVAACEVSGSLPLMKVSDYLTWVAEEILKQVLAIAWADMVGQYGWPGDDQGVRTDKGFIVVAYGKAGGLEMAHGSDLDLVFIHNCAQSGQTDGARQIDAQTFYTRLGQKIIHILNTRTNAGRLYEVDMRLRPSGNSGLLVSSLTAFARYQREQAWTWEHQALLRARPVAGSEALAQEFERLRQEILSSHHDREDLRRQVVEMRAKMRAQLASKASDNRFNIKQDRGGIVDIEFMVQFAALAWASEYPELVVYSDNIRILEALAAAGLMSGDEAGLLVDAYKNYRATGHRLGLQQQEAVLPADALAKDRQQVITLWQKLMEPGPAS